jgi:hypothetical protein
VANRADVAMRFRPLKLCLTHGELLLVLMSCDVDF